MCGIVGIIHPEYDLEAILQAMCAAIRHRGPDGEGIAHKNGVGIGMRRLSIIDVAGGSQPIYNEDGRLAIVFNGEIYNYIELKDELIRRGHTFQTQSDTETILHAYEEWGVECLSRLNGMFAFAIWERDCQRLFIARDRLGKKPLYYRHDGNSFAFASEIRALRQIPSAEVTLDLAAIHHYLSLQYIPAPLSVYREIRKLPPAHYLITDGKTLQIERYWELDYEPKWTDPSSDLRAQLRGLIGDAVRLRLRSDVPLGVFLSGGIDSTIILAEMAHQLHQPVEAFTISFNEGEFNEADYAARTAQAFDAHHHRFVVQPSGEEDLKLLVHWLDEPFANSSALPTFYLAQETRRHVTVALSGDGGDEVFGGYQRYLLDHWLRPYEAIPSFLRDPFAKLLAGAIRPRHDVPTEANWRLGIKRLEQVTTVPRSASILRWSSYFSEAMKMQLYTPAMRMETADLDTTGIIADDFFRAHAHSQLDRTLFSDLVNYLTDDGHVKIDRMSMANSLEVRNPFMDVHVVEFAARLPDALKIDRLVQKRILREAYADVLPAEISRRPKRGFAVPLSEWFNGSLRHFAEETLLSPHAVTADLFERSAITRLFEEHRDHRDDHGKRLWALLVLELWLRKENSSISLGSPTAERSSQLSMT